MGIVCRSFTLAPSQAWAELGRQPLGSRGRLRLTRSVSELQFIEHAIKECSRERGAKEAGPDVSEVLAAKEVADLYAEDLAAVLTDDPDDVAPDALEDTDTE